MHTPQPFPKANIQRVQRLITDISWIGKVIFFHFEGTRYWKKKIWVGNKCGHHPEFLS